MDFVAHDCFDMEHIKLNLRTWHPLHMWPTKKHDFLLLFLNCG
jgi:hypothetical protein